MRKQSSSFNTNRVLPVSCSNFHSIELQARELSIWCQHLLYLGRFFFRQRSWKWRGDDEKTRKKEKFYVNEALEECFFFHLFSLAATFSISRKDRVCGAFKFKFIALWSLCEGVQSKVQRAVLTFRHAAKVESHRRIQVGWRVHHASR